MKERPAPRWRPWNSHASPPRVGSSRPPTRVTPCRWVCPPFPSVPAFILAVRRSVGEVDHARAEDLRVHQLQRLLLAPLLEEALASANLDRVDHEPQFVQEVLGQQRPYQGAAAGDRDVLARSPLELA